MKYLVLFLLLITPTIEADEIKEEIIFQEKSFSQNNIISSIKSEEILLKLINSTENNNNFFYSLFDPLTNNTIYPEYSNEVDFFFESSSIVEADSIAELIPLRKVSMICCPAFMEGPNISITFSGSTVPFLT